MREPTSVRGESLGVAGGCRPDPDPSASGQFKIGDITAESPRPGQAAAPGTDTPEPGYIAPESSASAWTTCSSDYQLFAAGATRPFAWDAVRLVRIEAGSRVIDIATGTGEFAMAAAERGADVLATDKLGGLALTIDEVVQREQMTVTFLQERAIPTVMLSGGGYSRDSAPAIAAAIQNVQALIPVPA